MKKRLALIALLVLAMVSMAYGGSAVRYQPETTPFVQHEDRDAWINNSMTTGYIVVDSGILNTYDEFVRYFALFERYGVKRVVVYINSPGGDLFEGMAAAQFLKLKERQGYLIETHCDGLAASAASLIMAAGSRGHRYIQRYSFFMIHELHTFKFFSYDSVSQHEKEAAVLRKIQDTVDAFVASITDLTKEQVTKMAKEELWLPAAQAIKYGFADKIE